MAEIDFNVLQNYQKRTVMFVFDLKWADADHTILDAKVRFKELDDHLGAVPFSTSADADTKHGKEIWDRAVKGDYGPIAEYVGPSKKERRNRMKKLSPRQIRLALLSIGVTEEMIDAEVAGNPAWKVEWKHSTEFARNHKLIDVIGANLNLTPDQIDALWEKAIKL